MSNLTYLNEASVLHNLKARCSKLDKMILIKRLMGCHHSRHSHSHTSQSWATSPISMRLMCSTISKPGALENMTGCFHIPYMAIPTSRYVSKLIYTYSGHRDHDDHAGNFPIHDQLPHMNIPFQDMWASWSTPTPASSAWPSTRTRGSPSTLFWMTLTNTESETSTLV